VNGPGGQGTAAAPPLGPARVRSLRTPKPAVDPWRPLGIGWEQERQPGGALAPVLTVLLAGAECPFGCVFCDLWRHTLDQPTPPGAIPAQVAAALAAAGPLPPGAQIKLYNASNFFDERAVPQADDEALIGLLAPFAQIVVECHPRLVGRRCARLGARLAGRLQVAMGLETVHPEVLPRLGKAMTLESFAGAAARLIQMGAGVRAFALVGTPFLAPAEAVEWAGRTARWAFAQGAEHVSLIPLRDGDGPLAALRDRGALHPPELATVEEAFDRCVELPGVVTLDTWDLDRLPACAACGPARHARLERMNHSGRREPRVACERCA
jgi:radical SAM enzyme (TIGR01210 family)